MQKTWRKIEITAESQLSKLSAPAAAVLNARGIRTESELQTFISPSWEEGIHNPWLFRQMREAVEAVFLALQNGETITVHGDYDADGVTGSTVLLTVLSELKAQLISSSLIDFYIPHRDKEGYGLNPTSVRLLAERGSKLVITVDCGIANAKEIALATELGMKVIVVDHHQFDPNDLPAAILIHPRLPGEVYPFPYLAAVGVSWKFACALYAAARERGLDIPAGAEKWLLDLVAIATITDVVPLIGENRILETFGLKVLNKTKRPGLKQLITNAGLELGQITEESIGFAIGPRLNAAGRMDHASLALRLLLTESAEEASELGAQLEEVNKNRQKVTQSMMTEAEALLAEAASHPVLVLWSDTWSPSLVGLVAGRFLENTGKPTVAIGKHGERWVGSGRSLPSYDITEAVKRAGLDLLDHAGGHVQACGFSFSKPDALLAFVRSLRADGSEYLASQDIRPTLWYDTELSLTDLTWELVNLIQACAPYGEANRKPLFVARALTVVQADIIGKKQSTIRLQFKNEQGSFLKCIAFRLLDRYPELTLGSRHDIAFELGVNEWNGRREIQASLIDIQPCS